MKGNKKWISTKKQGFGNVITKNNSSHPAGYQIVHLNIEPLAPIEIKIKDIPKLECPPNPSLPVIPIHMSVQIIERRHRQTM